MRGNLISTILTPQITSSINSGPQNLILNGTFDDSSNWYTYLTTWTFSGGVVSCNTTSNGTIYQYIDNGYVGGATYKVYLTFTSFIRGNPYIIVGGSSIYEFYNANSLGEQSLTITGGSSDNMIALYSGYYGSGGQWSADNFIMYMI